MSYMKLYEGTEADAMDDGYDGEEFDYNRIDDDIAWAKVKSAIKDDNIKQLRIKRELKLDGKFVIATDGQYDRSISLYYQDQNIGCGYWTLFLSNAIGYTDVGQAMRKCNTFKYNNPRVLKVINNNGKTTVVEVYNGKSE